MPAIAMPKLIEEKLEDLARQVKRLWLYRGLSRVVCVAIVAAVATVLADRALGFGTTARWIASGSWIAIVLVSIWHFVIAPLRRSLTANELASAIESHFPSLSERLMTLVDLRDAKDTAHGSKPLMDMLVRETAHRTKRLDFEKAAPSGSALRGALLAGALFGSVLLAVLFISGGTARAKRFLLPWHTPAVEAPFAIKVSSGNVVLKRGEPVTLTAFLERRQADALLPTTAVLVAKDKATNAERKLPMTGDAQATFLVTWPAISNDFDYRVEAGNLTSEWYTVTVADPVELSEGTVIAIVAPEYAKGTRTTVTGFGAIDGLQHSQVEAVFKFNRPATAATLEWQSLTGSTVDGERFPVMLAEDRKSATAKFALTTNGTLRLTLAGEHGLKTVLAASVTARVDAPPKFEKAVGISERAKTVKPDETIILELLASDDLSVAGLALEYQINGGKTVEVPLLFKELGAPRVDGKHVFNLAGLVKDGDTLTYRVRATDSRDLPALVLKPQVTYFPEKAWAGLKIDANAESLDRQEVIAQKDAIQKKLEEAKDAANDARRLTEQVQRASGEKPMLTAEQVTKLTAAREAADAAAKALDEAARDASLTPELRGLAEAMRSTANDTVKAADDLLKRSANEPSAKARSEGLKNAERKLVEARERIEDLEKRNADVARNRLDKRRLEKLADDVNKLATEAEKATDAKTRDELLKKLQKAKDELRDVIKGNEALRNGAENAASETARKLAGEAAKLHDEQAKLADAVARTEAEARSKALEGAAKTQDDLNKRADDLRDRTATPARLTGAEPLAKPPFESAGEKLREGDPVGAMTEQEKAARDLERLAESLEKAAKERSDPREAAKQLAKLQDDLRKRMTEAAKKPLTDEEQKRFAAEQEAIRNAVDQLETPPDNATSPRDKAEALSRLKDASDAATRNAGDAADAQAAAAEAIRTFAEKLASREARMKAATVELEKLMREQENLARDVEARLKPFEKRKPDEIVREELKGKLKDLAKLQEKLAEKLSAVDAPGYEARRARTAEAAKRAAEDLTNGLPQDIPASQQDLKRRLAQLKVALNGGVPSDAAADELARVQARLNERLAGETTGAALADLQKLQREIADRVGGINDPDGAERLSRAKASSDEAAKQFQNADNVDELRKKTAKAAKDLDDLADHLAGVEADRERVERLAKSRKERAEWSKANAGKAVPPETSAAIANELEKELDDLKRTRVGPPQEAKKAAVDALERLKRTPNAEKASGLQKDAADALDQLAKKLPQGEAKRGERGTNDGDTSGDAGGQLPTKKDAAEARALAAEQRANRDAAAKAAATANPDANATEAQAKQQKELAEKTAELAKKLDAAAHASTNGEASASKLTEAAEAAKKAREQMDKAGQEQAAGRSGPAGEARGEAGKALEDAKAKASAAAGSGGKGGDSKAAAASKSAEEAGGHLRAAGAEPGKAAEPLKKAAEKIGEAADKLGEADGGRPGGNDGAGPKPLTTVELPADLQQYAGKPWGDLPGDVKTRIIQDLKAKYGEDYARVIKLYFEQLAEKK